MDMLGVTFIAVSKVIVSVLIGVVTTSSIPDSKTTLRDFGFLISTVLLTSLTLSKTAQSVNVELLVRCSILIFFSVLMIVWGLMWGMASSAVLFRRNPNLSGIPAGLRNDVRLDLLFDEEEPEETAAAQLTQTPPFSPSQPSPDNTKKKKATRVPYVTVVLSEHLRDVGVDGSDVVSSLDIPDKSLEETAGCVWAMRIGCSMQNGVTLPISLMTNIASSVDFIDFSQAAAYIFVFAISYVLYLWAAGPAFVERGEEASMKQRLIRELITNHKRMMGRCDATTQTLSFPVDHVLQSASSIEGSPTGARAREEESDSLSVTQRGPCVDNGANTAATTTALLDNRKDADRTSHSSDANRKSFHRSSTAPCSASAQTATNVNTLDTRYTSAAVAMSMPDTPSVMSPNTANRYAFTMATAEQIPYDWKSAGIIRVTYEGDMNALKKKTLAEKMTSFRRTAWGLVRKLMVNPPFLSVVAGIVVGVITPLRNLFFDGGALEMVMDAITLIGKGSIPSSLLLLGANLVGSARSSSAVVEEDARMRNSEQNTEYPLKDEDWELLGEDRHYAAWYDNAHESIEYELHNSFSLQTLRELGQGPMVYVVPSLGSGAAAPAIPMAGEEDPQKAKSALLTGLERALTLKGINKSFVWGVIALRLLVAPAFSFVVLVFLIKTMPFLFGGRGTYDKTLIMVLMVELASPTAINSTLIFNARQFMTYPWAKMLFFQYILCTVTMVVWASLGLSYVSTL